jgi:hypothetical protein
MGAPFTPWTFSITKGRRERVPLGRVWCSVRQYAYHDIANSPNRDGGEPTTSLVFIQKLNSESGRYLAVLFWNHGKKLIVKFRKRYYFGSNQKCNFFVAGSILRDFRIAGYPGGTIHGPWLHAYLSSEAFGCKPIRFRISLNLGWARRGSNIGFTFKKIIQVARSSQAFSSRSSA